MARGFDSKSVTDQQEAADMPVRGVAADADPAVLVRRRRLELSRADVLRQLESSRAEGHREMLKRALAALDRDLSALP
jgi:hypothetical protein